MKNPLRQAARNMMDQGAGTLTRLAAEAEDRSEAAEKKVGVLEWAIQAKDKQLLEYHAEINARRDAPDYDATLVELLRIKTNECRDEFNRAESAEKRLAALTSETAREAKHWVPIEEVKPIVNYLRNLYLHPPDLNISPIGVLLRDWDQNHPEAAK
jgi:hypothetical protein